MIHTIDSIKSTRKYLLELVSSLSTEDLNTVPAGFNNNIIWNMGHLVAAQQRICYLRAGLEVIVEDKIISEFKPDTRPERKYNVSEIDSIKLLLIETLDKFKMDFERDTFSNYNIFTTRYGIVLSNIEEATNFLQFHEGLHIGYIMAQKRVIIAGDK